MSLFSKAKTARKAVTALKSGKKLWIAAKDKTGTNCSWIGLGQWWQSNSTNQIWEAKRLTKNGEVDTLHEVLDCQDFAVVSFATFEEYNNYLAKI